MLVYLYFNAGLALIIFSLKLCFKKEMECNYLTESFITPLSLPGLWPLTAWMMSLQLPSVVFWIQSAVPEHTHLLFLVHFLAMVGFHGSKFFHLLGPFLSFLGP